jgi:hypothetical protein
MTLEGELERNWSWPVIKYRLNVCIEALTVTKLGRETWSLTLREESVVRALEAEN